MCHDADEPHLGAHDGNLEQAHPQPLRELPASLTPPRVLTAVRRRWSSPDLHKPAGPVGELVPPSRSGDRRLLATRNLGSGGAPFVSCRSAEAVQYVHAGEVALDPRDSHEAQPVVLEGDGAYTLLERDRGHRMPDQRPHLTTLSSAA
jgi:gentisate 1,2-dioxygenase